MQLYTYNLIIKGKYLNETKTKISVSLIARKYTNMMLFFFFLYLYHCNLELSLSLFFSLNRLGANFAKSINPLKNE